jgi:hypothetical protein
MCYNHSVEPAYLEHANPTGWIIKRLALDYFCQRLLEEIRSDTDFQLYHDSILLPRVTESTCDLI